MKKDDLMDPLDFLNEESNAISHKAIEELWNQQDPIQIARDLNAVIQFMLSSDTTDTEV